MSALMGATIHLFDVGDKPYGDCALIEFDTGTTISVMIDGGHRPDRASILNQLQTALGHPAPFHLDLLIISHAHDDHVGALPEMIDAGELTAAHALIPAIDMAFGPAGVDAGLPEAVIKVLALLREEPPDDGSDTADVDALAADAVQLRDRYSAMIDALTANGCQVVQFGASSAAQLRQLEHAFRAIHFKILGPSPQALQRTRELLFTAEADNATDAAATAADGGGTADLLAAVDAARRLGHLVNAQSIVCTFNATPGDGPGPVGQRILFGGDYQFADLGTSDTVLTQERGRLIERIRSAAPYAFTKLSHHGSDNAVDAEFLDALGDTEVVGIICGRGHPAHPDPETLALLDRRQEPAWVRTDRSGHITVTIDDLHVTVTPVNSRNIAEANAPDATQPRLLTPGASVPPASPPASPPLTSPPLAPPPAAAAPPAPANNDRITIEIPPRTAAVTIRLDFASSAATTEAQHLSITTPPSASTPRTEAPTTGAPTAPIGGSGDTPPSVAGRRFQIAAGRDVGRLPFLTDTTVLGDHIGPNVVAIITVAINDDGHRICDVAPLRAQAPLTADAIATALLPVIRDTSPTQVVILGGYDVIPAHRIDTIAPETPESARQSQRRWDMDDFYVWSDDKYVDFERAGLPDLPISRIPDGYDALFTLKALQAAPQSNPARNGVRNSRRPFAGEIFDALPGSSMLLISGPRHSSNISRGQLAGAYQYHMLHGSDLDGTIFEGETSPNVLVDAVTLTNLPTSGVDIAVLGCCWGALTTDTKARRWVAGQKISGRVVGQSIALSLIAAGARGVIGCTGSHYSPTQPPYNSNAGPMHQSLWARLRLGQPPASALLSAKYDFATHIATVTDANELAICNKTLIQFTCLGLGC